MPMVCLYNAAGVMLATGSAAIAARKLGAGQGREARENFTFMLLAAAAAGAAIALPAYLWADRLVVFLGAAPEVRQYCRDYLGGLLPLVPLAMLQMMFMSFFVAAGRPGLGLAAVAVGGLANAALDYLFIAVWNMGIGGAALATGIGCSITAAAGLMFFLLARKNPLAFCRPRFSAPVLAEACGNGASEMVSNLSLAVVTWFFNRIMLSLLGVDGVAAITIVLYAEFLLCSVYMGFSAGSRRFSATNTAKETTCG